MDRCKLLKEEHFFNNNDEITEKKKQLCYLLGVCEKCIPVCKCSNLHCVSCVLHEEIRNRSGPSFHTQSIVSLLQCCNLKKNGTITENVYVFEWYVKVRLQ